ncbi:T9SS type A sorting domain-containing protein [bacterium]|nr:T9SS type A sorting domain-containing protein [bacterium]
MRYFVLAILLFSAGYGEVLPTLIEDSYTSTTFELDFPQPVLTPVEGDYYRVEIPDFGYRGQPNGPMLFGRTFWVAVPKGAQVSVELIDTQWSEYLDIKPAPLCSLTLNWNLMGKVDPQLYGQHFGGETKIIEDAIWRGVRVVGVDIVPAEYDPEKGVRFMKSLTVRVNHPGGKGTIYDRRLYHPWFGQLYEASLVNPAAAIPPGMYSFKEWDPDSGAELLIICAPEFADEVQNWVEWKLWMGMPTKIATTDETGTSTTSVKNYIQNAYDNWAIPPVFVLLAGDAEHIATFVNYGGNIGDHDYTTLEGADDFSDVYIGRISADTDLQMQTIVQKHLNYERHPDTTDDWFLRAVGIVNEDGESHEISPSYCANIGPADSSYLHAVAYGMDTCAGEAGFISHPVLRRCNGEGYSDAAPLIAAGVGFVLYRGQAWPDYYYTFRGGLDTLDNNGKCHINISITCGTGDFRNAYWSDDEIMGERSTRAGTPDHPKGSVEFVGQTAVSSNSIERSSLSCHMFKGFFEEELNPVGAAHCYGKNGCWAEFGGSSDAREEFGRSALLGCPEMLAWTGDIVPPSVTRPDVVPPGTVSVDITVYRLGEPLKNARVALHHGSEFSYGITDSTGFVSVVVGVTPADTLILVVTGPNIYPYQDTIYVIAGGVAIYCAPTTFSDITGDHDGLINPGEKISFRPRITNLGDEASSALTGVVRTTDPMITFVDSITSFPPVAPGDTVYGDSVTFIVSEDHPYTSALTLTLEISGDSHGPWTRTVIPQPPIHRFEASFTSVTVDDSPPFGDGDGEAEPGENIALTITLSNNTSADGFNIGGRLFTTTPGICAVTQEDASYGDMIRGSSATSSPQYFVSISPETSPGEEMSFKVHIFGRCSACSYNDTITFTIPAGGDTSGLPTGPDSYGYYIIDDTDTASGLAPAYEWNDITTSGSTIGAITNSDDGITTIALPFAMRFYGNEYDSISVASNGFIAPPGCTWSGAGTGTPQAFPTSDGPMGVIAPMWADLAPHRTGGDIYSYYDSANHRFIIQYNNVEFYYGGGSITFQIVICDPDYVSTPTGDSEFYIYYNDVNISANAGVGIESPDETMGVQYYLSGDYDIHAAPIVAGRALRITTATPNSTNCPWLHYAGGLLYQDNSKAPGVIEPGDTIDMYFSLANDGSDNALFVSCGAVPGGYISAVSNANFGIIATGDTVYNSSSPLRFYISASCPPNTTLIFPVAISANMGSYKDTVAFLLKVGSSVGIEESQIVPLPDDVAIGEVHPNPFNSATSFYVYVGDGGAKEDIHIAVYSADGKKVADLWRGRLSPGRHEFVFRGDNLPSGVYFIRTEGKDFAATKKILLVK